MNRNHLGSFLRRRRRQLNLTPAALAHACRLRERSIRQLENGQHASNCLTLQRLATALGSSPEQLLGLALQDLPRGSMLELVAAEEEEPPP